MSSPKIDLFIIGAQKAGTTSLKHYLGEHPDISTHASNEFSFFYDFQEYSGGIEKAFRHYFEPGSWAGKSVVCKHAHLYSSEKGIERLKKHNPDCKLVFIMRDPVKRTLSSYLMEKLYNRVQFEFEDLPQALEGKSNFKLENWQYEAIVEFGFYAQYLTKIYEHFPKENVRLILFEDFSKHPLKYCREIFSDFGINTEFQPKVRVVHNETAEPKSMFYANFLKRFLVEKNPVKEGIKKVIPGNTSARLGDKLRNANRSEKKVKYEMPEEVNRFLKNYFRPHNDRLKELSGLDLSSWD